MYKLFCILCLYPSLLFAEEFNYPDFDKDNVADYEHCEYKGLFLKCEHPLDNCFGVKNTNQYRSPYDTAIYEDEQTTTGTACEYDIDGDSLSATLGDYYLLISIVNTYYMNCIDYSTYSWLSTGSCDPSINYIGDLTGGLKVDYLLGASELTTDGRLTYDDICVMLARNPDLKAQIILPYNTSCNAIFSYYQ